LPESFQIQAIVSARAGVIPRFGADPTATDVGVQCLPRHTQVAGGFSGRQQDIHTLGMTSRSSRCLSIRGLTYPLSPQRRIHNTERSQRTQRQKLKTDSYLQSLWPLCPFRIVDLRFDSGIFSYPLDHRISGSSISSDRHHIDLSINIDDMTNSFSC
jgi:hypothetical protein